MTWNITNRVGLIKSLLFIVHCQSNLHISIVLYFYCTTLIIIISSCNGKYIWKALIMYPTEKWHSELIKKKIIINEAKKFILRSSELWLIKGNDEEHFLNHEIWSNGWQIKFADLRIYSYTVLIVRQNKKSNRNGPTKSNKCEFSILKTMWVDIFYLEEKYIYWAKNYLVGPGPKNTPR